MRPVTTARRDSLSPLGLRDSHIVLSPSKRVTDGHCGQLVPAGLHCLWTWRLIVAIPSAEASYDPREPGERTRLIGILLARSASFERRADGFGGGDEALIGDIGCWPRAAI